MSEKAHDPHTNTRPGDVLVKRRKCIDCTRTFRREVIEVIGVPETSSEWVVYKTSSGENICTISSWRLWAHDAEAVK